MASVCYSSTGPKAGNINSDYWRLHTPPSGCDLILPPSMDGQYMLYFPASQFDGQRMNWEYQDCRPYFPPVEQRPYFPPVEQRPYFPSAEQRYYLPPAEQRYYSSDYGSSTYAAAPPPANRVIYHPPAASVNAKRFSTESQLSAHSLSHSMAQSYKRAIPPSITSKLQRDSPLPVSVEAPASWSVFHCDDPHDPHTTVLLKSSPQNEKVVEFRPPAPIHICRMSLAEWMGREEAARGDPTTSSNVFGNYPQLRGTQIYFTTNPPATHAYCDGHAIHVDDIARATFITPSDPSRISLTPEHPSDGSRSVQNGTTLFKFHNSHEGSVDLKKDNMSSTLSTQAS